MDKRQKIKLLLGISCLALYLIIPTQASACPGTQNRLVQCKDFRGNVVSDSFCLNMANPPSEINPPRRTGAGNPSSHGGSYGGSSSGGRSGEASSGGDTGGNLSGFLDNGSSGGRNGEASSGPNSGGETSYDGSSGGGRSGEASYGSGSGGVRVTPTRTQTCNSAPCPPPPSNGGGWVDTNGDGRGDTRIRDMPNGYRGDSSDRPGDLTNDGTSWKDNSGTYGGNLSNGDNGWNSCNPNC